MRHILLVARQGKGIDFLFSAAFAPTTRRYCKRVTQIIQPRLKQKRICRSQPFRVESEKCTPLPLPIPRPARAHGLKKKAEEAHTAEQGAKQRRSKKKPSQPSFGAIRARQCVCECARELVCVCVCLHRVFLRSILTTAQTGERRRRQTAGACTIAVVAATTGEQPPLIRASVSELLLLAAVLAK